MDAFVLGFGDWARRLTEGATMECPLSALTGAHEDA